MGAHPPADMKLRLHGRKDDYSVMSISRNGSTGLTANGLSDNSGAIGKEPSYEATKSFLNGQSINAEIMDSAAHHSVFKSVPLQS